MSGRKRRTIRTRNSARGPIARKVIAATKLHLEQKVTSLADWKAGIQNAEALQTTVVSNDKLATYDPLHAAYIFGQNQLSVLIEHIVDLPMVEKLADVYATAQEEHTPSGPPMSPLTASYFTCWGAFDLCSSGAKKETLATIAIDVAKALDVDQRLIDLYETLQASRMGIYVHEGVSGEYLFLRELITGRKINAICPAGYLGVAGELWFARVLPPLVDFPDINYSVVFTTPYLLGQGANDSGYFIPAVESDWLDYFARNLGKVQAGSKELAYEQLMKYGFNSTYWNEYVFLAYRNYTREMIFLDGVPDILSTLPHGELAKP